MINELQRELMMKDQEIKYIKNQQYPLTSSVHLNSEENVLDDFDDDSEHLHRGNGGGDDNNPHDMGTFT